MKERPILFSAPMIQAILAGTKTQTRRLIKHQPRMPPYQNEDSLFDLGAEWWVCFGWVGKCPYGKIGDQLWVREAWRWNDGTECGCSEFCHHSGAGYEYRATGAGDEDTKWKPSIHMPRKASRIQLEITGVRVERLQDISAKDIISEGAVLRAHDNEFGHNPVSAFDKKVYLDLSSLWTNGWVSINGAGSWAANPWVWVIEFKRV